MTRNAMLTAVVVLGLVAASVPVAAMVLPGSSAAVGTGGSASGAATAGAGESAVDVEVGQQLSTVMSVTSQDTRSGVDRTAFQQAVASANESRRVELVADRADTLLDRTEAILEDYEAVTEAYQAGELTRSEYAHQLALLNARARSVLGAVERLRAAADTVSALELRVAGYERDELAAAVAELGVVTGVGSNALLRRFTGEAEGEVDLETDEGLSIQVESDDGVRSREIQRPRDGDPDFTVSQGDALATARGALTSTEGDWVLTDTEVHVDHGVYHFEFRLVGADASGEAMVAVDASSGQLHHLQEEVRTGEAVDADGDSDADAGDSDTDADSDADGDADSDADSDADTDDSDDGLALVLDRGLPEPGARVTVQVLADGRPVEGATVRLDGEVVGTTGADGRVTLTLPAQGDAELTAVAGDRSGDLELGFGDDDPEVLVRNLNATGEVADGTARIRVTYNGSGVEGVAVYHGGERVGTTDADGTVTFPVSGSGDVQLTVEKGAFVATLELTESAGSLTLSDVDVQDTDGDEFDSDSDGDSDSDSDSDGDADSDSDDDTDSDSDADSDGTSTDSDSDSDTETGDSDSDGTATETESSLDTTDSDSDGATTDSDETTESDGDGEDG